MKFSSEKRKRSGHKWRFFRAGGLDQVMIRGGTDIAHLEELDPKLWTILSCPLKGVTFDQRTLELIDSDRDGRIRVRELLDAVKWTADHIKDLDSLMKDSPALPLAAINDAVPSGAKLLACSKRILSSIGKPDAEAIAVPDIADRNRIFAETTFNGDGIVPEAAAADPETQEAIRDVIKIMGAETDRSGRPGVNKAKLDAFFEAAQAYTGWIATSGKDPSILPLGAQTAEAADACATVRSKIEDFFSRCALSAFDSRATGPLGRPESDYVAISALELMGDSPEIAALPLAAIRPNGPLPLKSGVNPAWAAKIERFHVAAVNPLLGGSRDALGAGDWRTILARLAPYEAWIKAKAGSMVEPLGVERVRSLLAGDAHKKIDALIARDAALADEVAQIDSVEKLIRFHRDLNRLIHNYVNFSDFYDPRYAEIFRWGRLYMDGRACDLCFLVEDMNRHATLAGAGKIYLAYCELVQPATKRRQVICGAFTAGFAETLWVGRNGVFYDREGTDWEATIVKVVENPISLKEAFWSPWKKIASMVGDQVRKLLAAKEAAVTIAASKGLDEVVQAPAAAKPRAQKMEGAALASSVAAIGIAVGLVGSAVGGLISTVSGLPLWKSLAGVAAVILVVSAPSVILAYFKLRSRDLAPILNACGWAVNGRIRMTMPLGREFTMEAVLPAGATRTLTDPYADSGRMRNLVIALCVVAVAALVLWKVAWFDGVLPAGLRSGNAKSVLTVPPGH